MKYVPMTDDEILEIFDERETFPDHVLARNIEQAVLSRIEQQGLVIVPREPTDEMAHSAVQHIGEEPEYYYKWNTAKEVYKAMLEAAKEST